MFGIYIDNGKDKQGYFRNFISGGITDSRFKLLLSDREGAMEFATYSVAEDKANRVLETLGEVYESAEFYSCMIQLVNFSTMSFIPWHSGSTYAVRVKTPDNEGYFMQRVAIKGEGSISLVLALSDTPKKLYHSPESAYGVLRGLQKFLGQSVDSYEFSIVPLGE